jgi:hypothetical protein
MGRVIPITIAVTQCLISPYLVMAGTGQIGFPYLTKVRFKDWLWMLQVMKYSYFDLKLFRTKIRIKND